MSNFCINYIDDILVFSQTFEAHIEYIEYLLNAIIEKGFRLKLLKCNFTQHFLKYLGYRIQKTS